MFVIGPDLRPTFDWRPSMTFHERRAEQRRTSRWTQAALGVALVALALSGLRLAQAARALLESAANGLP